MIFHHVFFFRGLCCYLNNITFLRTLKKFYSCLLTHIRIDILAKNSWQFFSCEYPYRWVFWLPSFPENFKASLIYSLYCLFFISSAWMLLRFFETYWVEYGMSVTWWFTPIWYLPSTWWDHLIYILVLFQETSDPFVLCSFLQAVFQIFGECWWTKRIKIPSLLWSLNCSRGHQVIITIIIIIHK